MHRPAPQPPAPAPADAVTVTVTTLAEFLAAMAAVEGVTVRPYPRRGAATLMSGRSGWAR